MTMRGRTKDEYNIMAREKTWKFQKIAKELGKDHPAVKIMGELAWGRHGAEQGPDGTLQTAIREAAFLDGFFDCLNHWAHIHDYNAQQIMLKIWHERAQ